MSRLRRAVCAGVAVVAVGAGAPVVDAAAAGPGDEPLPTPVTVRQTPEGVTLADPAFTPLPGARADFGRVGGAAYRIEMPDHWNGRLVLYMHGFEDLEPEAQSTAPDIRRYLVSHGYAWGASSFSSTSIIPARSALETAALWDFFARKYGRPTRTYVMGLSMGGGAATVAAERYGSRFDGALGLCGSARHAPATTSPGSDFFVVGAYLAGVTQAEYDAGDIAGIIRERIRPALRDPRTHRRFEDMMIALTGGPRAYAREGVHVEETTNWRRAELLTLIHAAQNRPSYGLGRDFERRHIRLRVDDAQLRAFLEDTPTTGKLAMPLLTMHTTGDGQVPIEQAQILRRVVDAAGRGNHLVQRVVRDPGHCGFTTEEQEHAFAALVGWVEHGRKPAGTNLAVRDLRHLDRTFELMPRQGSGQAGNVRGAHDRAVLSGRATVDGRPFDADFVGAVVLRDGLSTACQATLPPVTNGRYRVPVLAYRQVLGCGRAGSRIVLWTFVNDRQLYSTRTARWPGNGRTLHFAPTFSTTAPRGAAPETVDFAGEVYRRGGRQHMPLGTRVEAYVGTTRCALSSTRETGSFSGFIMNVAGPESVPGCTPGATITFRIDGRPAVETVPNAPHNGDLVYLTVR